MRVAFVQGGPSQEAVELQAARLKRLAPDRYHIEASSSGPSRQRLVELLDSLQRGDELCITSLASLCLEVGEAAQLISDLLGRGIRVLLVDRLNSKVDIGKSAAARDLLEAFAGLHRQFSTDPLPKTSTRPPDLLTEAEIEDIRRLHEAGLSPRRIGLIYRRSPRGISDLLWPTSATPLAAPAGRHGR